MESTDFRYSIHFRVNEANEKIIVLTQSPFYKGAIKKIEIPLCDIESVIYSLKLAKEEATFMSTFDISKDSIVELDQNMVDTLVSLFLSGISISILSNQYKVDELSIANCLEKNGIILVDDI